MINEFMRQCLLDGKEQGIYKGMIWCHDPDEDQTFPVYVKKSEPVNVYDVAREQEDAGIRVIMTFNYLEQLDAFAQRTN